MIYVYGTNTLINLLIELIILSLVWSIVKYILTLLPNSPPPLSKVIDILFAIIALLLILGTIHHVSF